MAFQGKDGNESYAKDKGSKLSEGHAFCCHVSLCKVYLFIIFSEVRQYLLLFHIVLHVTALEVTGTVGIKAAPRGHRTTNPRQLTICRGPAEISSLFIIYFPLDWSPMVAV